MKLKEKLITNNQVWFLLFVTLYSLLLLFDTRRLHKSAALIPKTTIAAILIITAGQLVALFLNSEKGKTVSEKSNEVEDTENTLEEKSDIGNCDTSSTPLVLGLIFMFPLTLYFLGFSSSIIIFCILFFRIIGKMKWLNTIVITSAIYAVIYFFFIHLLGVSFSMGFLW